jgi:hypothetical protein
VPSGARPQPPVGTCRVAIGGTNGTLPFVNVFYLKLTDNGTQTAADLKTVVDAMVASYHTRFAANVGSSVTLTNAQAAWILTGGAVVEYSGSYSQAMTGGTEAANGSGAYVLNWTINQYYRGGHPRTYMPGVITADISNLANVSSAKQSALATSGNSFITDVNALTATNITGVALGTVSFARANAWRVPPVFYPYHACSCRQIIGTQRRRLGGR